MKILGNMKKNVIIGICACLTAGAVIFTGTAFAQGFTKLSKRADAGVAGGKAVYEEGGTALAVSSGNNSVSDDEGREPSIYYFSYPHDKVYAKCQARYNIDGQGYFRAGDSGKRPYTMKLESGDKLFYCTFNLAKGADPDKELAVYKNIFAGGELSDSEHAEQYLDQLIREDVISVYACVDADMRHVVEREDQAAIFLSSEEE